MSEFIRTPQQVEEAHELLQRWRKLDRLCRPPTDMRLADNLHSPFRALLSGTLTEEEFQTIKRGAIRETMGRLRALRDDVFNALLKLGVDPRPEEKDEDNG